MKIRNAREGLTLIEVLIVAAIFGGIMFVISSFISGTSNFSSLINEKLQAQQDLGQTFQIIITEIRSIGASATGGFAIESAASSSLVFFSDTDGDGVTERVRYFLATSTLNKGITKASGNPLVYTTSTETVSVVAVKVVTSTPAIFTYYGADYTGSQSSLTAPINVTNIRLIVVAVSADISPRAPKPAFFTDTVDVRGLRSN